MDRLVRSALKRMFRDLANRAWYGRERDIVSLFAFGHVLPLCQKHNLDQSQLGIEVPVPRPTEFLRHPKAKHYTCKDFVIWPLPKMTVGDTRHGSRVYPRIIVEWKSLNRGETGRRSVEKKRCEYCFDIEWLRLATLDDSRLTGYAVLVEQNRPEVGLRCARISRGDVKLDWLTLGCFDDPFCLHRVRGAKCVSLSALLGNAK